MATAVPAIADHAAALAYLDAHVGRGVRPGLERIRGLLTLLGDPHLAYPVIHVAGTNGKTTTARLASDILGAHGLRVGTFTSPHLHRVEERFLVAGRPLTADELTRAVRDIAWFAEEYERRSGDTLTYFELTAALAFDLFATEAIDVAVVEVGLGGRLDATNVVDGAVSVITGIAIDHTSYLGTTLREIAAEKAAILGSGGVLVTGPLPAAAEGAVTARVAATGARWYRTGPHLGVVAPEVTPTGRRATIRGIHAEYPDVELTLRGRHQLDHLATAVAAVEAFLDRSLDLGTLRLAAAAATSPGRIEVVGTAPLVVVDGAHNLQGMTGLAATLREEFPERSWRLVVGVRGERDPAALLAPLAGLVTAVHAAAPDDTDAIPADVVAAGATTALDVPVTTAPTVAAALAEATRAAGSDGAVVVAGSLYVAGEARAALIGPVFPSSPVHVRYPAPRPDGGDDDGEG